MFLKDPFFLEKLAKAKQNDIMREIEGAPEPPAHRAKSEIWITVVVLLIILIWFFT